MTITFGFYDSVSSDRQYNALQMSSIFDGIITDGILMGVGDALAVTERPTPDLNVVVGIGRAWFNHTWTLNDADLVLPISTPSAVNPRYDAVILEVNSDAGTRANDIKILTGTPSSTPAYPTLTNTETLHQYVLAYIYVGVSATAIINANITNKRGTTDCPWVTGVVQSYSSESLVAQWESQFYDWFNNLVDQLTGVQVTNLQNQIDQINAVKLTANRDYYVRPGGSDSNDGLVDNDGRAFLTIQHAVDVAVLLDSRGFQITIHVADGNYQATGLGTDVYTGIILKRFLGDKEIIIVGNEGTPGNVQLRPIYTSVSSENTKPWGCSRYHLKGIRLYTRGNYPWNLYGVTLYEDYKVNISNCELCGSLAGAQYNVYFNLIGPHSKINLVTGNTFPASYPGGTTLIQLRDGSEFVFSHNIDLAGSNFTNFSYLYDRSTLNAAPTFSGGYAIGKRYWAYHLSLIDCGGLGDTHVPGTTAGSLYTGSIID